mmetsp:Transcript_9804/g.20673  ORF Transcript_9804/g.20673 Transcript_9804/m.20673 type:complete len:93 (+) Transcript_9804:38-316(+)
MEQDNGASYDGKDRLMLLRMVADLCLQMTAWLVKKQYRPCTLTDCLFTALQPHLLHSSSVADSTTMNFLKESYEIASVPIEALCVQTCLGIV